jgi:hypothetical protein
MQVHLPIHRFITLCSALVTLSIAPRLSAADETFPNLTKRLMAEKQILYCEIH